MAEKNKGDKNVYKDTLNLPETAFDMRAGLLTKEPAIQEKWAREDLYGQIRKAREDAKPFILHDGPPYANGNIHIGHALNKVLKDMVNRIRTMEGFDSPYIPGWDCHGLPIEQKVMDDLGPAGKTMEPMDIRRRCFDYAKKYIDLQSQQFQRLGVMGEFDHPYITMDPAYESAVMEVFAELIEQGLVYKQLKPVHWSIENRTALADAELEYQDRDDTSVYVAFKLTGESAKALPHEQGDSCWLLIWTTTPWTLPANEAVAIHPDYTYCLVHGETAAGPATFVIAESRMVPVLEAVLKKNGEFLKSYKVISRLKGQELLDAKLKYLHPLLVGKTCPVVAADYVTLEDGTGLVHTAPGHGIEDYGTGLKNKLPIYCPVLGDGTFDKTAPAWLQGLSVWQGNGKVIDFLRGNGTLMMAETIRHSYPHDWRSKTPTIFRATEQWFIAVDRALPDSRQTLRGLAMDNIRREGKDGGIDFYPSWGRNRIAGMLESRPDWCISRQRSWGLPIPAFYNKDDKPLMTAATVRAVAAVVAKQGSDAWFKLSPKELLAEYDPKKDKDLANPADFPLEELKIGRDIFDVWFESGSSWYAVLIRRGLIDSIPTDLYLEGSDQHRGWFQLSLLPALGARRKPPFKSVLTHGFVVDEEGYKMSKSVGNVISPMDQLEKRGADILRLWIASQNYQDDVRCSESLIGQSEDAYRKIRNTLRFCMGSCSDFDPAVNATEPTSHSIDLWMKMQLHQLVRDVRQAYASYEFHRAMRLIYEFCTVQASSVYLSAVKDRLYCESPDAIRRRATQTVIHETLVTLIKLLAPVLVHTCEEAWEHIPHRDPAEPHTVHLASLPNYDPDILAMAEGLRPVNPDQLTFTTDSLESGPSYVWSQLMELRAAGLVKLEALRNSGVKNSLDAEAVFSVAENDNATLELVETYIKEMEDLLGVGYARIEKVKQLGEGVKVEVDVLDSREKYARCARSWKRRPDVGSDADYPELSARDAAVMKEISEK